MSASWNLIRSLLICRRAPVSTLARFVGVISGVSDFGFIGQEHPWFVLNYTFREAKPAVLGPVHHRGGLAWACFVRVLKPSDPPEIPCILCVQQACATAF